MAELDQKFASADINSLKEALVRKEVSDKTKDDRILFLETTIHEVQKNFDAIMEVLQKNSSIEKVSQLLRAKSKSRSIQDDT